MAGFIQPATKPGFGVPAPNEDLKPRTPLGSRGGNNYNATHLSGTPAGHGLWGQTTGGAPDPGKGYKGPAAPAAPATPPGPYGSESGPGILESWFNQRSAGTDPAYEYAMKRGMESLGNRSAAAGSFNSGAARQQESDFAANMGAQRLGQLDALAGGASGEHQGRLNAMFGQGGALAGGQARTMGAYDLAGANAMNTANQAILSMFLNKAGVDDKSRQGGLSNLISLGGLFA